MDKALNRKPGFIVASLVIANFLGQLMQTMLTTALPRMMEDLSINENRAQWLSIFLPGMAGIGFIVSFYMKELGNQPLQKRRLAKRVLYEAESKE
ncbi:hypothetical protein [Paenibacillus donghaensis]|uniref:Major facilitator superfamily (MFS) profile domain-containing protein n=1 Tax=Paenibacillus donghaensis TaxID=414771 RepID=A0A2Z2K6X8_9BACL|nr:hypothetical protein [Paenibacillus donghaensis]ASA20704.1 hypothetical protein B9T62_07825 [Paenibacillus donghaensis]